MKVKVFRVLFFCTFLLFGDLLPVLDEGWCRKYFRIKLRIFSLYVAVGDLLKINYYHHHYRHCRHHHHQYCHHYISSIVIITTRVFVFHFLDGIGKNWYRKMSRNSYWKYLFFFWWFLNWYQKKLVPEKSLGTGIVKFGIGKSLDPVLEKIGTEKVPVSVS